MSCVRLTPLGGLGETGALNCMLYETDTTAILVDCGVSFVDDRHPGASLILPNFDYLEAKRDKIKAIVLTHGHEDHIGALPYLIKRFALPIYATPFTLGIIQNKFADYSVRTAQYHEIDFDQKIKLPNFEIEPIFVNHSMMDVTALFIRSNGLSVFHCTDFKIDHSAPDHRVLDLARLKKMGQEGLDLLLLDSTNALSKGWTLSETKVRANLLEAFTKIEGRIIACLFSSNTFRIQSLLECARITGRKVALTGRGTREYFNIATELNRVDLKGVQLYDVEDITDFADHEILVIATGSQGEYRSVLYRMSKDMFRPFKIKEGDTVLMSSKMIPGNEGRILDQLDRISALGATILHEGMDPPIHASGHAKEDELREVIRLVQPKFFIPIHGGYRQLKRHREIAIEEGVSQAHSHVILNGDTVELNKEGLFCIDQHEIGVTYISENRVTPMTADAIKRRKKLAWNGLVSMSLVYDQQASEIRLPVQMFSEGMFGDANEERALSEVKEHVERIIKNNPNAKREGLARFFKIEVRKFYHTYYEVKPEVVVLVHDI